MFERPKRLRLRYLWHRARVVRCVCHSGKAIITGVILFDARAPMWLRVVAIAGARLRARMATMAVETGDIGVRAAKVALVKVAVVVVVVAVVGGES